MGLNFIKIAGTARYGDFIFFQDGAHRHLGFLKFLTFIMVKRVELHHRANFRRNHANRGRDM